MTGAPRSFARARSVRATTTLLAALFAVTIVGIAPAVAMLLWAWGRLELDDRGIRYRPIGGAMAWAAVERVGIGVKTGMLLAGDPSEHTMSTLHVLLADRSGRVLAVPCSGFEHGAALLAEIQRRAGVEPEELSVSFFLNRLSFADDSARAQRGRGDR
ncbi:MAG: hypothetical protein VX265_04930 [Myxococcota bacterium]|nr:hypothetical protein [Myxococcota bacterium]